MRVTKFIIFTDSKRDCTTSGDNFLNHDIKLDYWSNGEECAIGLMENYAQQITDYKEEFDVYLFNDTGDRPESDSIFFEKFCNNFFKNRNKIEYKVILHFGSSWNFNSIKQNEVDDDGEKNAFANYNDELCWLQSLNKNENWIYQSHTSNNVYCNELKDIAKAIVEKNKINYHRLLNRLNDRFIDESLENLLLPFQFISPYEKANKESIDLLSAKAELKAYIEKSIKKSK